MTGKARGKEEEEEDRIGYYWSRSHRVNGLPNKRCPFSGHAKITEQLRVMTLRLK